MGFSVEQPGSNTMSTISYFTGLTMAIYGFRKWYREGKGMGCAIMISGIATTLTALASKQKEAVFADALENCRNSLKEGVPAIVFDKNIVVPGLKEGEHYIAKVKMIGINQAECVGSLTEAGGQLALQIGKLEVCREAIQNTNILLPHLSVEINKAIVSSLKEGTHYTITPGEIVNGELVCAGSLTEYGKLIAEGGIDIGPVNDNLETCRSLLKEKPPFASLKEGEHYHVRAELADDVVSCIGSLTEAGKHLAGFKEPRKNNDI